MRLSAENLHGRTVITADGQAVGSVKSVFLDAAEWRVESISIELRKDVADRIGATRSVFHRGLIELPVQLIQSVGDAVVLAVAVDALREAHRTATGDAAPPPDARPEAGPDAH
jgi:sporulation protein YlmC with PRC-barrel domain